jgi:predicted membrane protein
MLTRLRRHPLLAGAGEVLTDAVRYLAIMAVLVMLLGYVARLVMGTS